MDNYECEIDFDELLNHLGTQEIAIVSDDGEDLSSIDSGNSHLGKRRLVSSELVIKKPRKVRIPRILVQDIRKCYTKMFQNVINSNDFPLLYGFLETYYAPNPLHTTTKWLKGVPDKCFTMNFFGLDEVAKYWYCVMNMNPDNVMVFFDHTIQHTTGKAMTHFHGGGTRVYEELPYLASYYCPYLFKDEKYNRENLLVRDSRTNDIIIGHSTLTDEQKKEALSVERKKDVMRGIMESVDRVVSHLPLRHPPQNVQADGMLVISTDENKRITKMEMNIVY